MLRRVTVVASLLCFWPLCAAAQCDPGGDSCSTAVAAQKPDAQTPDVGMVIELRAAGRTSSGPNTPDAPLPSDPLSPDKNRPHGVVGLWRGTTEVTAPDVTLQDALPVSEFGGTVGGGIGRERTFYFVSFDQLGLSQQKLWSLLNTVQAKTGNGALPPDANPMSFRALAARVDHQFGERDSAYARFSHDDLRNYSLQSHADGTPSSLTTNFQIKQQSVTAANTFNASHNIVNETKAQFLATDVQLPAGAPAIGVESDLPTARRNRIFEAADNVSRQFGGQNLRMGGDFLYNQMNISFLESSLGRASMGDPSFSQSSRGGGLYVESGKKIGANVLLTTGIRYDIQMLQGFKTDTNNLAPQVGLAWAPHPHTVIRGSVGMYYDQIPLPAIAGPMEANGVANIQSSGKFVTHNDVSAGSLGGFTTSSPTIQNSYVERADFQVEQQIGTTSAISVESQYARGVQLAQPVSRSVGLCATTSACRAGNVFWGQEIGTGAVSSYSGTTVAFTQQPVHWGNYKVSYTYGMAQETGTGENSTFLNDTMRRASFTGVLHSSLEPGADLWQHLANGFVLTTTGDYSSRSEFAGIDFFNFNARLTKTLAWGKGYRLDAVAETFNAMQRTSAAFARSAAEMGDNFAGVFMSYQKVASEQSPNASRLGLRVNF